LNIWWRAFKKGTHTKISAGQINQLLELGFVFEEVAPKILEIAEIPFERRLKQLQKIKDELGHLNIDPRYHKFHNVGGWAAEISKRYKDTENGNETLPPLEEEQFNELRLLGFEFNISHLHRESHRTWQESFETFLEFQQYHGHSNVPVEYKADVRLGIWVSMQRHEYKLMSKGKPSKMTQEKCGKLESAGFLWAAKKDQRKSTG